MAKATPARLCHFFDRLTHGGKRLFWGGHAGVIVEPGQRNVVGNCDGMGCESLQGRQGGYAGQANDTLETRLTTKPVAENPCSDMDVGRHLDDPRASPTMGLDDGRDASDTISDRA